MLDRAKLISQVSHLTDSLFVDYSNELSIARAVWERISNDPTFIHRVRAAQTPWPLPIWQGKLNEAFSVAQDLSQYQVISVDGSQIYPDRHQGTRCFLINIGTVVLNYQNGKPVHLNSVPYVFAGEQAYDNNQSPTEVVNCYRQALEFEAGIELSSELFEKNTEEPSALLYDGSLIFWHLDTRDTEFRSFYLNRYCASFEASYQEKILMAGYVSMPKSKELINLIRIALCDFDAKNEEACKAVEHMVDVNVAQLFLKPYTRSTVFKSNAKITQVYPEHLAPYFFYLHCGTEIGRVEIPAWIAREQAHVDMVAKIILDQCIKGYGYPVVLAEAHEQAVVKGPDREFFYHLITKLALEQKKHLSLSPKSLKKRRIGI